jgi:hypothetical protein
MRLKYYKHLKVITLKLRREEDTKMFKLIVMNFITPTNGIHEILYFSFYFYPCRTNLFLSSFSFSADTPLLSIEFLGSAEDLSKIEKKKDDDEFYCIIVSSLTLYI